MSHKEHLEVDYLARAEGETAIRVELDAGATVELKVFEPPRFFEGFLVGRKFDEVGDIVSRICGICPVSHMTTAIEAIEKALDIPIGPQTRLLRQLMTISQIAASHLVHLYMLSMPDYYGYTGIAGMLKDFKKEIAGLIKMKEVMNDITGCIGGRALHPVTHLPGGFTRMPEEKEFLPLIERVKAARDAARMMVKQLARLDIPRFEPDTEFVALGEGRLRSNKGLDIPVDDYTKNFTETQTAHAYAKQTRLNQRGSIMVGALARVNINFDKLLEETRLLAGEVGFNVPNANPFFNNLAQGLEIFNSLETCCYLMQEYSYAPEKIGAPRRTAGEACSITEAPRGLLYHCYRINSKGEVARADIVTPTAHNFLNMERDLRELVKANRGKTRETLRMLCEELVRAYDPCFSCSVH